MNIDTFLSEVKRHYATGKATEHSYRPALKQLLSTIENGVFAINEPKRVACGAPDFHVYRKELAVGYVEAKDLGKDLRSLKGREAEQKQRYLKGLPNLIYTNCLDFQFYRKGNLAGEVSIGELTSSIQAKHDHFNTLENHLRNFAAQRPQTITSPEILAHILAGKTALIRDVVLNALIQDQDSDTDLAGQYDAFKNHLIEELAPQEFADLYAETVTYGLLAARLYDSSPEDFSRSEALELLPRTNPFLRSFFTYIAAADLDDRLRWIVDDVADALRATDADEVMARFGSMIGRQDPFIHFYETFLQKYNPDKRRSRGVWYTPEPVVHYIVRAIDETLKQEFDLPLGLADTSKVTIDWDTEHDRSKRHGQPSTLEEAVVRKREVHRVQVLDPATGTGTFLSEVIKRVAPRVKQAAEGIWPQYVENDLIPRIHGFELLMASYAMCHLKLGRVLAELGYEFSPSSPRLSIYLTDSLEEPKEPSQALPFARWLSNEAKEASTIKGHLPIMCVIGNPPYSGESANAGDWIDGLMEDYKREPGTMGRLVERTAKWINNDYVKFIRLAQHLVESNGEGVVGLITDHGYLDNPTFRGMRWALLRAFDKILILDLHGNTRRREDVPDGISDKNVFDIQQGVAVLIGIKRNSPTTNSDAGLDPTDNGLAQTFYGELWGSREAKYEALWNKKLYDQSRTIFPQTPTFYFRPWDYEGERRYNRGFGLDDFFKAYGNGIVTKRDRLCIQNTEVDVQTTLHDIEHMNEDEFRTKYQLPNDVRDWKYEWARADVIGNRESARVVRIHYRPFDDRYVYYSGVSRGFLGWPVQRITRHYIEEENIGLLAPKALSDREFAHVFVASRPSEAIFLSSMTGSNAMNFPLYTAGSFGQRKSVNLDSNLFAKLSSLASHNGRRPTEMDAFDYIYGVLHCCEYRLRNRAFLKRGFPRIPWPKSPSEFWTVADKGGRLRQLHLMVANEVEEAKYPLLGQGESVVSETRFNDGAVWINDTQRFDGVPSVAWMFHIGGYQPAQKWLKDRQGRQLRLAEILHYQRIIKILVETDRIMKTIHLTFDD